MILRKNILSQRVKMIPYNRFNYPIRTSKADVSVYVPKILPVLHLKSKVGFILCGLL